MKHAVLTTLLLSLMLSATFLFQDFSFAAEAPGTAPQINLDLTLSDNLMSFKGKAVTITLASGQTVSGIVKNVKNGYLHLEKLAQKDFFDAIIVIDKINAVEVRVR